METLKYKKTGVKKRQFEAIEWYKEIVGTRNPTAANFEIYREETGIKKGKLGVGFLQHFTYLAKGRNDKKKLPYWDAFPLAMAIDVTDDSFLSLNFHYLGYGVREKVLKAFYDNLTSKRSVNAKVKINYDMVKSMSKYKFFKPAIKRHLFSQIKSKPILIPPSDYDKVLFLPSEDFLGASKNKVFAESNKIIKGL